MIINFYSLKDSKIGFGTLFPFANDELAKNAVVNTFVNDSKNPMSQCPSDFELYYVGKFNDVNGEFIPDCYLVGSCSDIIQQEKAKRESAKALRKSLMEVDTANG